MKKIYLALCVVLFFCCPVAYGQTQLSDMDTKAAKTGFLLNFGIPSHYIDKMRANSKQYDKGVSIREEDWLNIYDGLVRADARPNKLADKNSLKITDKKR